MNEEKYGIEKEEAHENAVDLIPEDFFWSCVDELAPFGSDEGDIALSEYRRWRRENPETPTIECLKWVIEAVGEIDFAAYNEQLLDPEKIKASLLDEAYDDQQYIHTLDISVIATGFAQLVDEGTIETQNKPIIQIAINRQIICAELAANWEYANEFISNLNVLSRALKEA